jgi:carboxymethylenebutenolidase
MGAITIGGGASTDRLEAYLAVPDGEGPWPGVVVIHEAYGLNDDIRSQADRFAGEGYLAIAPNLYTAGGVARCVASTLHAVRAGQGRAYGDIEAARQALTARDDCSGRVGVIGFCMGGGFALMLANRGFDVTAPNYGFLPKDMDAALDGACPVVASYGRRDLVLHGTAAKLESALEARGIEHDVKEYPGVGHSFLNKQSSGLVNGLLGIAQFGHNAEVADDAWRRILAFFAKHLRD